MKLLVPVLALLAFGQASAALIPSKDIQETFDGLLEEDDIKLSEKEYDYRLGLFTVNFMALEPDQSIELELMYSEEELEKQNGAKLLEGIKSNEELQKREDALLLQKRAPLVHDNRGLLKPAVSQRTCGNCYLHVYVAAVELAYRMATGELVKFSEQELTDCYNNGCDGGDYRMVALTMSYLDKMSERNSYVKSGYSDGQFTCRADTTPDALDRIKVAAYIEVTTDTVADAVYNYGSVMTCMKWATKEGDNCYMKDYKGGIADFPPIPAGSGCDHAVLIVGYGPGFYIVRNSHGSSWGNGGYFTIKRGTNVCGIEDHMASVLVDVRTGDKAHSANGCPLDKPHLCEDISTCVADGTACVSAISQEEVEELEVAMEEEIEERGVRIPGERKKREEEEKRLKGGHEAVYGKREEEKRKKNTDFMVPGVLEKRGVTAEALEEYNEKRAKKKKGKSKCRDKSGSCKKLKTQGVCYSPTMKQYCLKTCNLCGGSTKDVEPPKESAETHGPCITPTIAHGTVSHGHQMATGTVLVVKCDEDYTLVGETVRCLIQNVFTNEDKDARLLPECVKLGKNILVGDGAGYSGDKNTYTTTYTTNTGFLETKVIECDSWNKDVLRGVIPYLKDGLKYKIGNHNYCRNPFGDQPVPFCLSSAVGSGKITYCFKYPGCDVCAGAITDNLGADYCAREKNCAYKDINSKGRVSYFWEHCRASCCAEAGC